MTGRNATGVGAVGQGMPSTLTTPGVGLCVRDKDERCGPREGTILAVERKRVRIVWANGRKTWVLRKRLASEYIAIGGPS